MSNPVLRIGLWAVAAFGLVAFSAQSLQAQESSLVRVDPVKQEQLSQSVPVIGRLVARQAGEVSARISGPVEAFRVDVGDRVEKDQIIAILNEASHQAQRDLAAGRLAEAEADLATTQAEMRLARQDLQRLEALKSSNAFSQARYDDSKQSVVIAEAEVQKGEAAVASARAELRMEDLDLSYTKIRAPYDGVVTQRMSEAGAYVQLGDPLVFLIADHSLEIEAEVPFQRLSGLTPGTRLPFSLDDGSRHQATVRAVLPSENPLTRTRTVRLVPQFDSQKERLADRQSVTVQVPLGAARNVITVHKDAIIKRQGQDIVYVVEDDSAQPRQIRIGEPLGSRVEILDGLAEGEAVVVRGNERLQPGAKVHVDGAS
ncbi:MAG: efflux RND transporter periplasmic adaptor subunit [Pseudomonadota bacterium]